MLYLSTEFPIYALLNHVIATVVGVDLQVGVVLVLRLYSCQNQWNEDSSAQSCNTLI
jgi:hypothetical protein